ncbi:serine/threonine-protein kinase unc-51-like isoform X1 [Eriocheir sinensis]|uniref:serine/threonine-protein kinase unc-51-like isoform X1 n=1 Tax=Eriocheir sinensis TaxID=95602 RepID=UPI0021CA516A|nr:serine/threonine-protein kinase unc-51-like isoform X1 [Eriocheir sinensis]
MEVVGDYEYSTKDLIGHGAFAVVFKGRHRQKPGLTVAIKSITKKNIAKSQNLLSKEIKILKELTELHHENVVALLDCKETANHVYLVMEYCNGGDLADYLQAKGTLSEDTIRFFLRQMAESMRALYGKGIVHRDLKPQNILLAHAGKPNPPPHLITLKIADFGFARFLQDGVMAATLCGSPMYMAPEVIMSIQYDAKADLWSLGTIVFQCLVGKAPFHAQTPQALKQFYEKNANLAPRIPSGTSPELVDLLNGLLKRNAKDRMDFETFFNHPFIRMGDPAPQKPVASTPASATASSPPATAPKTVGRAGAFAHPAQPSPSPPAANLPPSPEDLRMSVEQRSGGGPELPAATVPRPTPVPRASSAQQQEEAEDFVMVPAQLPNEPEPSRIPQGWSGRILAKQGGGIYQKNPPQYGPLTPQLASSPRPSHLPVQGGSSGSTHSSSSSESCRSGEPVPVPSQRATFHQMTSSGSSDQIQQPESPRHPQGASPIRPSPPPRSQPINMRRVSDHKAPDLSSLSPPAVQFTIGDPPMGGRRRSTSGSSYSTTPPTNIAATTVAGNTPSGRLTPSNSPLRQSGRRTPPFLPPQLFSAPPMLPPILGSPTKLGLGGQDNPAGDICGNTTNLPLAHRAITLPEMTSVSRDLTMGSAQDMSVESASLQRSRTESHLLEWQHAHHATSPPHGARQLVQYGQSAPPSFLFQGGGHTEGHDTVAFYAPPLHQETLMEKEHNETLAKLNFVLALVDCILELARSRSAPITALTQNTTMRESVSAGSPRESETSPVAAPPPEWQRRAEQLVLYMRALQLLNSALTLAKHEKSTSRLQPSNAVKNVVGVLNERFRQALNVCKDLSSAGPVSAIDSKTSTITADRLIYNYAIEMCQSAALDELFGKPEECFRRYQTAQILLHALAQQVAHDSDRSLLTRYKQAVERRLFLLHEQGIVHAYNTNEA